MTQTLSLLQKKQLEKDIKMLDKNEHLEILKIIQKNEQNYSKNSKGVFFNLKYVEEPVIYEIKNFVDFCKTNKPFLEKINTLPENGIGHDSCKNISNIKIDIEMEKILSSKSNKKNDFTFKNYLDKISIIPIKEFKNERSGKYPDLINITSKFTEINNRILKKCKNSNNTTDFDTPTKNKTPKKVYLEAELH
tara:strand:+ start:189 stop:764 length:576 start_codon:yes stop_codon:yes gene_type:complete